MAKLHTHESMHIDVNRHYMYMYMRPIQALTFAAYVMKICNLGHANIAFDSATPQ